MFYDMIVPTGGDQVSVKIVYVTMSNAESTKVTTGFRPRFIAFGKNSDSAVQSFIYDETISTTKYKTTSTTSSATAANIGAGNIRLVSVDDDGFTVISGTSSATYAGEFHYFVIG